MSWIGPFYFLDCSNRGARVSLPITTKSANEGEKNLNAAEYWSERLGLDLRMPNNSNNYSNSPEFKHEEYDLDPEVVHNAI